MKQIFLILVLLLTVTVSAVAQLESATPKDTSYVDVAGAFTINSTTSGTGILTPFSASNETKEFTVNNVDIYFNGVEDTTKMKFEAGKGFGLTFIGRLFATRYVTEPPIIHITATDTADVYVYMRKVLAYTGGWAVASAWVELGSVNHDSRPDTIPTLYKMPTQSAADSLFMAQSVLDSTSGFVQFKYFVVNKGVKRLAANFKTQMDRVTTGSGSSAITRQRTWQGLVNITWRRDTI